MRTFSHPPYASARPCPVVSARGALHAPVRGYVKNHLFQFVTISFRRLYARFDMISEKRPRGMRGYRPRAGGHSVPCRRERHAEKRNAYIEIKFISAMKKIT